MRCGAGLLVCSFATLAWGQQGLTAWDLPIGPVPSATSGDAAGPGLRWTVPLALSGSLGYDMRSDHVEGQRSVTRHLLTARIEAASFIYQPWFALVNASLGVTGGISRGGDLRGTDHDEFVTGGIRLSLFPRSRFPFEARYEVSDSRIDPALGGVLDYRSRNVGFSQRYRPADGSFSVLATYERREQEGEFIGVDTQDVLMGDFSARWRRQNFNATLSRSLNRRRQTDERTDFRNVVLRHSAGSGQELSVENSINWALTDDRLNAGDRRLALSQWSSVGIWRPSDRPLTLTGSARGFRIDASEDGLDADTVALAVGASYEVSPRLRLSGSATALHSNGQTETGWNGTLGATYQGDTRQWGPYSHHWYAGSTLSRAQSGGRSDSTVSGQLGHGLSRVWGPEDGATWSVQVNQVASGSYTRGSLSDDGLGSGPSRALSHTLGLSWNQTGADHHAFFRLSLSDARQFDGERAQLQLVNAQLSGTRDIDRRRSWTGDMTLQRVFQRSEQRLLVVDPSMPVSPFDFDRQITHTVSGEIAYRQIQVFGVPRLVFSSRLRISRDAQRQLQALVPLPDRETGSWENRLEWQIGRLDASAGIRTSRIDDLWRHTLHLRVLRNFGE